MMSVEMDVGSKLKSTPVEEPDPKPTAGQSGNQLVPHTNPIK
jgi:hypothetical protein